MNIVNNKFNFIFFLKNNKYFKLNILVNKLLNLSRQIIIFTDSNISKFILIDILDNFYVLNNLIIIEIPSGEKYKNIFTCIKVWNIFNILNIDRNSIIINIGGGVITDIGGFIASTFKRGIEFINFPTSFLSMVDASFGGKTGIDLDIYKNTVGTFNESKILIINSYLLKYLSNKELISGLFEVIKCFLINSKYLWNWLNLLFINNNIFSHIDEIIFFSLKIKYSIINDDYNEIFGKRKLLNFGHTIGHAIESYYLYINKPIPHGYAIGLGMLSELFISTKLLNFSIVKYNELCDIIYILLNFNLIYSCNINKVLNFIYFDKKNINNNINFTLLKDIGYPIYNCIVNDLDLIRLSLNKVFFKV